MGVSSQRFPTVQYLFLCRNGVDSIMDEVRLLSCLVLVFMTNSRYTETKQAWSVDRKIHI